MTAKHRAPHPKRRQKPDDLEKRVRRIERNYAKDAAKIARAVARVEITEHEKAKHAPLRWSFNGVDLGPASGGTVTKLDGAVARVV